ncbi:hypothetical protein Fot_14871 [Forsythia ovata]|uniref:Uncharacterized protein n=1 Tax=Forsythia ovata TaxID=205694 RepID=A0ABD1W7J7_9LAMI
MHLGQHLVSTEPQIGVSRFNRITDASVSMQRPNGPSVQAFSLGEVGSTSGNHDLHGGYAHHMTKQSHFIPQNSPSRLGQLPIQRHGHGRSTGFRGSEWSHFNVQPPQSSYNSGGPHSPRGSGMQWGRRGNYPVSNIPSASHSHGRKDYGRTA